MKNLQAEMKRYGVSILDIQDAIGCTARTARNKVNDETAFTYPEAAKIRDEFFEGMRLEYLFSEEAQAEHRKVG